MAEKHRLPAGAPQPFWCNCLIAIAVTQYFPGELPSRDCSALFSALPLSEELMDPCETCVILLHTASPQQYAKSVNARRYRRHSSDRHYTDCRTRFLWLETVLEASLQNLSDSHQAKEKDFQRKVFYCWCADHSLCVGSVLDSNIKSCCPKKRELNEDIAQKPTTDILKNVHLFDNLNLKNMVTPPSPKEFMSESTSPPHQTNL